MPRLPVIAITCDTAPPEAPEAPEPPEAPKAVPSRTPQAPPPGPPHTKAEHPKSKIKYESPASYACAVAEAGGVPILLPYEADRIDAYLALCDGFLLTGGDDPATEPFGEATHPRAKRMTAERQTFELALLAALDHAAHPVLGVCLGMQLMALHAGGRLHQHMPEAPDLTPDQAAAHDRADHAVRLTAGPHPYLQPGVVHSRHHQAIAEPGALRIVAASDPATGAVIEAVDRPGPTPPRPRFYLGVQWHPERTEDAALGRGLIRRFVEACRDRPSASPKT